MLEAAGDARALRAAIEQLAHDAITPQERARHLTHAAEIDELRLDDDESASALYARALTETPEDEMIADRLLRVLARRVVTTAGAAGPQALGTTAWDDLLVALAKRAEKATTSAQVESYSFQLASLLVAANKDLTRATRILEDILDQDGRNVGALRLLEAIARRGTMYPPLARVLKLEGDGFGDVKARLGALWELAGLETWRLTAGESVATYTRILELDPTDPSGLEAAVRLSLGPPAAATAPRAAPPSPRSARCPRSPRTRARGSPPSCGSLSCSRPTPTRPPTASRATPPRARRSSACARPSPSIR